MRPLRPRRRPRRRWSPLPHRRGHRASSSVGRGVPAGTDAAPPAQAPALPGGAIGFSHYVFEQVGGNVVTTLVEGPRHLQVRVPASYRQLKEWADAGSVPVDLNMSLDELSRLVEQLDTVRAATEKYRDVDVALKAGYRQATEEVPNMGAHFVHPLWSLVGKFDPARRRYCSTSGTMTESGSWSVRPSSSPCSWPDSTIRRRSSARWTTGTSTTSCARAPASGPGRRRRPSAGRTAACGCRPTAG